MSSQTHGSLPDPCAPLAFAFSGPIQRAFIEQVARRPQACAIVSQHEQCTYAELDELSSRVASCLRQRGVGRGHTVVLFSNRNPALVWSMLGALKSGAAFFVADAAYPAARIVDCIALAKPSCLLVCGDVAMPEEITAALGCSEQSRLRVPATKAEALQVLSGYDSVMPPISVDEHDVAYVSFTSGSTGKPKGICTTHAALPHFVAWHVRKHGFGPEDRFSLLSGLSHDPALRDIFTPLSIGASLHIPAQEVIFDPDRLSRWLSEQAISVLHLTPALGQIIVTGAQDGASLRHIRYFFWGGDVLSPKLSQRVRVIAPNATQVNFYGATETPQAMSYFVIDAESELESYPIGTGIADVQLLVLTPDGRLAGVGEIGDILIRTRYLSQGYLDDPQQTHARFVANPFTRDPLDRCYSTGDLGKYLADGNVLFAGRADHQVKIRGFRVELDEVTIKLEQQPGVARAVVLAQDMGRESKVLVAYFCCDAGHDLQSPDAQQALRRVLPAYMVPSYVVRVQSFPLLPNGKIDLLALPPAETEGSSSDESARPMTARERELVELWQTILGVQRIGVDDSFADLGGDSLSAIRALVAMRRRGLSESVARGVLQGKTIAQIVREEEGGEAVGGSAVAPLTVQAQTSLLVNLLRGLLVVFVVTDHWIDGLLARLPPGFGVLKHVLSPLLNLATPGFALVFGIALGHNYYPTFRNNPDRVKKTLRFGQLLVGASVLLGGAFALAVAVVEKRPLNTTSVWSMLFGPLLYYFLALSSAPLWFRFIARYRSDVAACLGLTLASYVTHRLCMAWLLDREQLGFLQLCRLMLVAKYAYFNMSIAVLAGVAFGIALAQQPAKVGRLDRLLPGGGLLLLTGTALLYQATGSIGSIGTNQDMGLWRWFFYAGLVVLLVATLRSVIDRFERLPSALRTALYVGAVVGQCSLQFYVLHGLVLQVKALLDATGLPESITLTLPALAFFAIGGAMMRTIYLLYHGSSANAARQAPSLQSGPQQLETDRASTGGDGPGR